MSGNRTRRGVNMRAVAARSRSRVAWGPTVRGALRLAAPVLVVVAALAGIGLAATRAGEFLDDAPGFRVDAVEVTGIERIPEAEIVRIAGIEPGASIFDVDIRGARERLVADPRIADATVEKSLPATIRIRVYEREPVALLAGDGLYLVGDDGAVYSRVSVGEAPDLPVLTGFDLRRREDDPVGLRDELVSAVSLLGLVEEIGLPAGRRVAEVHRAVGGGLDIVTSDGLPVHLGSGPYRDKLHRLARVEAAVGGRGLMVDEIHMSGKRRPERITVRVRR